MGQSGSSTSNVNSFVIQLKTQDSTINSLSRGVIIPHSMENASIFVSLDDMSDSDRESLETSDAVRIFMAVLKKAFGVRFTTQDAVNKLRDVSFVNMSQVEVSGVAESEVNTVKDDNRLQVSYSENLKNMNEFIDTVNRSMDNRATKDVSLRLKNDQRTRVTVKVNWRKEDTLLMSYKDTAKLITALEDDVTEKSKVSSSPIIERGKNFLRDKASEILGSASPTQMKKALGVLGTNEEQMKKILKKSVEKSVMDALTGAKDDEGNNGFLENSIKTILGSKKVQEYLAATPES